MDGNKPLRNYLRKVNLVSLLQAIWFLTNHLDFGKPLPPYLRPANPWNGRRDRLGFFQWHLDTLAREAILHCPDGGGAKITHWTQVREALNKLKWADEQASKAGSHDVFAEMTRIGHRQFHWQHGFGHDLITRTRKLYRYAGMNDVVRDVYGLSSEQVALGGFAMLAIFMEHFAITPEWPTNSAEVLGFDIRGIVENLTTDLPAIRQATLDARQLNENWSYTFHPLWLHPLVRIGNGTRRICPLPGLLARRITHGLYFDVAGHDVNALSRHMGPAFQAYVGDCIRYVDKGGYQVFPEERYGSKSQPKDTVDWIVEDGTGTLFIETKLLKMGAAAKTYAAPQAQVMSQFKKLAAAIGQVYATLSEGLAGRYPTWRPNALPIHPMVVTMDDWLMFAPILQGDFDKLVDAEMARRGIDRSLLSTHRYVVCCIRDFESAIQVMHDVGIHPVMREVTTGDKVGWHFFGYLQSEFSEALQNVVPLFSEEHETLLSEIGDE